MTQVAPFLRNVTRLFKTPSSLSRFYAQRMSSTSPQVSEAFVRHGIVPDVIQKAPENNLNVSFDNGLKVELGNVLTPSQVKKQPHNIEWNADKNTLYTLVKTDPDAPSRDDPKFREWLHWLVVNIPGTNVGDGKILSEYIGPGPLEGTGLHRYVYLVYKQPGKLSDPEHGLPNRGADNRGGWSVAKFAQKHNLGAPVAGNFFKAEYDYLADLNDKYRRSLAETENVRRRGQKQVEDAKVFAIQSFCKDLLEVADTLDLAIGAVKPENIEKNAEVKNLYDGVVMMKTVLLKTFEKHGLVAISPNGEKFDPYLHEAVFQIPKDQASAKPGHIEHVMKIGYSLHGRPIRAAQVGVVQN